MGSSISKYLEENVGHFGNNAKEIEKVMSDREIMDSKYPNKKIQEFIDDEVNQTITIFEEEYPDLSNEFIRIQTEMYAMFAAKHMDYGLNNISLGGDIVNNSDDKKFSLTGLAIRLTDKISRLRNLMVNGRNYVKGEGMEDTFIDIANYGIIGLLVGRDKWKK
ncbi:DUF1599 domain-containing protein [bacterium]|jgi:hypothetical protein|nr:DUF1599 domain-containing protein [bacterium]MDB4489561.1 DUF1599 domain-containing protein [bacterium]